MQNQQMRNIIRQLLTEIVRLRFKNHQAKHPQMDPEFADDRILGKVGDMEQLVVPLFGEEEARVIVREALEAAREDYAADPSTPVQP
ncbi:hypothetical protein [Deinococcus roseus]|uniref:Uncharacterized protein n=1 Tax=Deinococcus roseus TaxID=392414 RepID=A0ABQ2DAB8_9DEIO|nr:hypothetical protein [Deinococcus roseus]GGJ51272.1 hypothetical protein GCM10008938_41630 [Deinococcus roseus]